MVWHNKEYFYHGTSSAFLAKIQQNGLCVGPVQVWGATSMPNIFVTTDVARAAHWAKLAVDYTTKNRLGSGSDVPVILRIQTTDVADLCKITVDTAEHDGFILHQCKCIPSRFLQVQKSGG